MPRHSSDDYPIPVDRKAHTAAGAAFTHLVPLQLLNYFVALERGLNPDTGRQDQPAHAAASRHYKY